MHQKYSTTPLSIIGNTVAWHEAKAKIGSSDDRKRHSQIAKSLRKTITDLFIQRYTAGEYNDDIQAKAA